MHTDVNTSYTTATIDLGGGIYIAIQRRSNNDVGFFKTSSGTYSFTYEDLDQKLGYAVGAAIAARLGTIARSGSY